LHAETEPVSTSAVAQEVTLESDPNMQTIPAPVGGAKIVSVNLTGALSEEEKQEIKRLRKRDAQVRRHEQAHLMTAGPHAHGSAHYTYQVGPDGKRYAIGGEVQVDMSPVQGDPEATLHKAEQLEQAALAPMEPSAADRNVAMAAEKMAQQARHDIAKERSEEMAARSNKETIGVDAGNSPEAEPMRMAAQPDPAQDQATESAGAPNSASTPSPPETNSDVQPALDLYI